MIVLMVKFKKTSKLHETGYQRATNANNHSFQKYLLFFCQRSNQLSAKKKKEKRQKQQTGMYL